MSVAGDANGPQAQQGHAVRSWLRIAVIALLPGVGFIGSMAITNAQENAVAATRIDQVEEAQHEHAKSEAHPGAVSRVHLTDALASIEKLQAVRDEQIRRELTDIKASLARLEGK